MPATDAVILIAHGSRAPGTVEAHATLAASLAAQLGVPVHPAFLEISPPDIPGAIAAAVAQGSRRLVLLPYFLLAGNHTSRDIPAIMAQAVADHPGVELRMTAPLGPDPRLLEICADRASRELAAAAAAGSPGG